MTRIKDLKGENAKLADLWYLSGALNTSFIVAPLCRVEHRCKYKLKQIW